MKKSILLIASILSLLSQAQAAVLVHAADDTDCFYGDDVLFGSGPNVEVFSARFELSPNNRVAASIVEDYVFTGGTESPSWPYLFLDFENRVNSLVAYSLYDFWPSPAPSDPSWIVDTNDSHSYPFGITDSGFTRDIFYLSSFEDTEVWIDWTQDTTLRITWGQVPPAEFNWWLSDGSLNPNVFP